MSPRNIFFKITPEMMTFGEYCILSYIIAYYYATY